MRGLVHTISIEELTVNCGLMLDNLGRNRSEDGGAEKNTKHNDWVVPATNKPADPSRDGHRYQQVVEVRDKGNRDDGEERLCWPGNCV